MAENLITLIETAKNDWAMLDRMVREEVAQEISGDPEREDKFIKRAVDARYLTKEAKPAPEDRSIFIGAVLQRYVEFMDTECANDEKYYRVALAQTAFVIDALHGLSWPKLSAVYEKYTPLIEDEGAHVGWLRPVSESAKLIREDIGMEPFVANNQKKQVKAEEEETQWSFEGVDVIEGFEKLRFIILDLLHDETVPDMTPDTAAALLLALGLDKPARMISKEKLDAYKTHALSWLTRKLSYVREIQPSLDDDSLEKIELGRHYLARVAAKYPTQSNLTAPQWLANEHRAGGNLANFQHVKHAESYMAFALHDLLTQNVGHHIERTG